MNNRQMKKAWITNQDAGLVSLTLEAVNPGMGGLDVNEFQFRTQCEQRRTIAIGLLTLDDLRELRAVIDRYVQEPKV